MPAVTVRAEAPLQDGQQKEAVERGRYPATPISGGNGAVSAAGRGFSNDAGQRTLLSVGRRILPVLSMLVLVLVITRRILAGRVLAGGDLHIYFFPYWMQVVRSLRQGQLPLWNSTLFAGAPLAANSQVGLFYPLNWPFWILAAVLPGDVSPLSGLPGTAIVTRLLHLNVLMHLCIAALSCWYLGRRVGLGSWPASFAGLIYAGSGFLGLHLDHLNQLQALAWMPILFLPYRPSGPRLGDGRHHEGESLGLLLPRLLSVVAMTMILLSGHLQMAFIAALGVIASRFLSLVIDWPWRHQERLKPTEALRLVWRWLLSLLPYAIAGLAAGIQLLPTLQLAGLSGRSLGLDWREAVSFSLRPWELLRVVLPTYLVSPVLPEGVAYVGIVGLLAAGLGVSIALRRRRQRPRDLLWVVLGGIGLLLALGAYNPLYLAAARLHLPGFIHFRAPARFLALYVLGASILAGLGVQELIARLSLLMVGRTVAPDLSVNSSSRQRLAFAVGLVLMLGAGAELVAAAEALPHAHATSSRSYTDLRPATAHLIAGTRLAEAEDRVPARFLSISEMLFEIGDKAEIEAIYDGRLSTDALWSYMVAAKQREILAPNLPLAFGVPAVDGYDGGLLPLRQYITFSELLIPGGTVDGRLREGLLEIPDGKWLDLLGVGYVLTDKTGDVWVDDILYDRQFQPTLRAGDQLDVGWLPADFEANAVGVLYSGGPLQISTQLADGRTLTQVLPDGASEGAGGSASTRSMWLRWSDASPVVALSFGAERDESRLIAASLVDERVGAFYALALSDRFRLAHSGDVKIYEALAAPARATIVHNCEPVTSAASALDTMARETFAPSETLVAEVAVEDPAQQCIASPMGLLEAGDERAAVVLYRPNQVIIEATLRTPGYLLLKDAWYPGWQAWIEDLTAMDPHPTRVPILHADLLYRALALQPGTWRVTYRFVPVPFYIGLALTVFGAGSLFLYSAIFRERRAGTRS